MSNAQSMGSSRRNSDGTIVGFKVTLLSLVGLMVATPILQWDILVYFMVLFPAAGGVVSGLIVASVSMTGGVGTVPRWLLLLTAFVIDVAAIAAAYMFF